MKTKLHLMLLVFSLVPAHAAVVTFRVPPPTPVDHGRCSAFSVYMGVTQYEGFGRGPAKYDESAGAALDCSWSRSSERTAFLAQYSGSYTANRHYQIWNGGTNELGLSVIRRLTPQTTWINRINLGQIDASDSLYQRLAALKTSYTSSINAGRTTDESEPSSDLAQLANSSPIATDRFSLWSVRQRYVLVESTFVLQKSERTSWYTKLYGDYTGYGRPPAGAEALFSRSFTESGVGIGVNRHLNERTIVGFDLQASREQIPSQSYLSATGQARISRLLTPHWSVSIAGGGGTRYASGRNLRSRFDEAIGSASISYRGRSNALIWSVSRGLSVGPTAAYSAELESGFAWIWERPNAKYTVTTMAQYNRGTSKEAAPIELKLLGLSIGRRLSRTTSIFLHAAWTSGQGVYLPLSQGGLPSFDTPASQGRAAVRLAFVYTPRPGR